VPGAAVILSALIAVTAAPAEQHQRLSTPLAPTTKKLTISASTVQSCTDRLVRAGTQGASVTRWTAPLTGYVQVRLNGDERNDWDLALFDSRSGRLLDASLAWGANEMTQAWVKRGQSLTVQACRLGGPSAIEPLEITPVKVAASVLNRRPAKESLVSIPIATKLDFSALEATGINLDEVPNGHRAIAVLAGPADAAKVHKAGYSFKTLIPDMAAAERGYRAQDSRVARAKEKSALPSGRTTYRHYPDIQADLKKLVKKHKGLVKPLTLPVKTFQGRDIAGVEITERVKARDNGKPIFWLMAEHHAREWPSAEAATEFAIYLAQKFRHNRRVTNLLKRVRVVVTPVINVDGYLTSREATDPADISGDPAQAPSLAESVAPPGGSLAYRRKNCHGASDDPSTPCNLQYGIDNNRNYGAGWGGPGAGTDPNTQNYRGEDMWSEPENQAVWHYSQRHDVTTLITTHNFASLVLRPPGRHNDGLAPDETALKKLGDHMARDTGYTSEYGYQLYDTSGTTEDWNYAAAGTFGYTIEMGPDSSHGGNFHISYQDGVIDQWTGAQTLDGKGKGLRDALLRAADLLAATTTTRVVLQRVAAVLDPEVLPRALRGPRPQRQAVDRLVAWFMSIGYEMSYIGDDTSDENADAYARALIEELDLAPAAASDQVTDTVHYGELAQALAEVVAGEPVNLIERLADRLATVCLRDPRVTAATVTVHKPQAPIPLQFADVAVTLRRTR
jgi:dihydroneopterin aldolase